MSDPIQYLRELHYRCVAPGGASCAQDARVDQWRRELIRNVPALLDALDAYERVAESASDQWGDDYLWEKWGHDKDIAKAREAMAGLNKDKL